MFCPLSLHIDLKMKHLIFTKAVCLYLHLLTSMRFIFSVFSKDTLADLYNERGFTKYLYVDFDGAVADYTLAIEQNKKAVYFYNRGLIHYRLGKKYVCS